MVNDKINIVGANIAAKATMIWKKKLIINFTENVKV